MSPTLLHQLKFEQYEEIKNLTLEQCKIIAEMAAMGNFHVENHRKPGETLYYRLYNENYTLNQVEHYLSALKQANQPFRPQTKIAVLIANLNYSIIKKERLVVPESDCKLLSNELEKLGFNVVILKNLATKVLKEVLSEIFNVVPEKSYCFVFYAGHACEVSNVKCILGVDGPEDVDYDHCITEKFVLGQMYKSRPAFCMFIMDTCSTVVESCNNKEKIEKEEMPEVNSYTLITCSTITGQEIYENVEVLRSTTAPASQASTAGIIKSTDKYHVYNSSYLNALCKHIHQDVRVGELIDMTHQTYLQRMEKKKQRIQNGEEVENPNLNSIPTKIEYGFAKRSLHDPAASESAKTKLISDLTRIKQKYGLL